MSDYVPPVNVNVPAEVRQAEDNKAYRWALENEGSFEIKCPREDGGQDTFTRTYPGAARTVAEMMTLNRATNPDGQTFSRYGECTVQPKSE